MEEPPDFGRRRPIAVAEAVGAAKTQGAPTPATSITRAPLPVTALEKHLEVAFEHLIAICDAPELLLLRRLCKQARGIVDNYFTAGTRPAEYRLKIVRLIGEGLIDSLMISDALTTQEMFYSTASPIARVLYCIKLLRIHTVLACAKTYLWRPITDVESQRNFSVTPNGHQTWTAVVVRDSFMMASTICYAQNLAAGPPAHQCPRCSRLVHIDFCKNAVMRSFECYKLAAIRFLETFALRLVYRYTSRDPSLICQEEDSLWPLETATDVDRTSKHVSRFYNIGLFALFMHGRLLSASISPELGRMTWEKYAACVRERILNRDAQIVRVDGSLYPRGDEDQQQRIGDVYTVDDTDEDDIEGGGGGGLERFAAERRAGMAVGRLWPWPRESVTATVGRILRNTGIGIGRVAQWTWRSALGYAFAAMARNYTATRRARRGPVPVAAAMAVPAQAVLNVVLDTPESVDEIWSERHRDYSSLSSSSSTVVAEQQQQTIPAPEVGGAPPVDESVPGVY